jgi:hypothetical protein
MKFAGIAMASALLDSPAGAEGEAFCREYAQNAVNAFQENVRLGTCFASGSFAGRWLPNFDEHFNWCRSAPAVTVNREQVFRENQLRVCRREPKGVGCNEYASNADNQQASNLSGRCGFTDQAGRWLNNYDEHLAWCLATPPADVNHEFFVRFAMLGVCARQEPYLRCDGYARRAMAQVTEATSRRCGFGGGRWSPLYENHLTFCVEAPADTADSETREREGPLSQCRTTNPLGPPPPPPEACLVSVIVSNQICMNLDGTASSIPVGSMSQPGCGADPNRALQRAKSAFSSNIACLSDGNSPSAGCCTFRQQVTQGCLCQ